MTTIELNKIKKLPLEEQTKLLIQLAAFLGLTITVTKQTREDKALKRAIEEGITDELVSEKEILALLK